MNKPDDPDDPYDYRNEDWPEDTEDTEERNLAAFYRLRRKETPEAQKERQLRGIVVWQLQRRFIAERMSGKMPDGKGGFYPPCSREEAVEHWLIMRPVLKKKFRENPHWLNFARHPDKWAFKGDKPVGRDINPLQGQRELTYDDLLDMWQKAQTMPEPDRTKAIQQITHLSRQLESNGAQALVSLLLEGSSVLNRHGKIKRSSGLVRQPD